ncbi:LGFP repeat-containing protein [Corynebacterium auriscanis]|uniref:LGFP repeat-containing protein n=1 Tax=Corynebacterium auriscanis TaxID=99807 RepID=UPI003CF08181
MNVRRKFAAIAAGSALLLGAAACSDEAQNDAKNKANEATSAAGNAAGSATSAAGSAMESATSESDKDDKDDDAMTGAKKADADDMDGSDDEKDLPAEIKTAWDNAGGKAGAFGMLKDVDEGDNNVLATFEKGWMTYSKDTGAVPLKGKIGETWAKEGGLDNKLGLPTAPEKGDAASGWTQSFQNGVLKWAKDASGTFTATTMNR